MGVVITHTFVSPVPDNGVVDEVGPNEWNDDHVVAAEAGFALGASIYGTSSGTNTILAVLSAGTPTLHLFKAGFANTGAATFNGADLLDKDGNALANGAIQPDVWYWLVFNGTDYRMIMSGAVT